MRIKKAWLHNYYFWHHKGELISYKGKALMYIDQTPIVGTNIV
jgi:hypothetical protein